MTGNVWEWVFDGRSNTCSSKDITDPVYPVNPRERRGCRRVGSWRSYAAASTNAFRGDDRHYYRSSYIGFRPACTLFP